jgi:cytochrome c7-like protein/cytochrome c554/c'-like protein
VTRVLALLSFVLLSSSAPLFAQLHRSLCADCHYANLGRPNPSHLHEWDSSAHQRAGIGCEACHGGNPTTVEPFLAHQSIVRGHGLDSPVHPSNLPRTCGRCHAGPYIAFQKSKHDALLRTGDRSGPTCSTCHGTAAAQLLNPKALESQCNSCHGKGKKFERLEYADGARVLLQGMREVRQLLETAQPMIKRADDERLRTALQYAFEQAQVPLVEAARDAHSFYFTDSQERLAVARARANALLQRLASARAGREGR